VLPCFVKVTIFLWRGDEAGAGGVGWASSRLDFNGSSGWRLYPVSQQEWTWRSSKNDFRIDHVFGNKAFVNRFSAFRCVIDHKPRLSSLTDHSAIVLETD
jgi:hypothetical protein